jgi:uncharacterized protein
MDKKESDFMKKIILLSLTILLMACSPAPVNDQEPIDFTLVEGSGGTALSVVAGAIAGAVETSYPGSTVTTLLGRPDDNPLRVSSKQVDFGLSSNNAIKMYFDGGLGVKNDNLRVIATFNASTLQFAIHKRFNITSFEQLVSQKPKIRIRLTGPETQLGILFDQMLAYYGETRESMSAAGVEFVSVEQAAISEMVNSGALDGYFTTSSQPAKVVSETFASGNLVFMTYSNELLNAMKSLHGHLVAPIKKEAYSFLNEDVMSFATYTMLFTHKDVDDEIVRKVVKAIVDNIDLVSSSMADLNGITPEYYLLGVNIPLHPAAEAYYKEIGILD